MAGGVGRGAPLEQCTPGGPSGLASLRRSERAGALLHPWQRRERTLVEDMACRVVPWSFALGVLLAGCQRNPPAAPAPRSPVAAPQGPGEPQGWPPPPIDGSPVGVVFETWVTSPAGVRQARLAFYNYANRGVAAVEMRLHYLDEKGSELRSFPWTSVVEVEPRTVARRRAGAFVPDAAASVRAEVVRIRWADGTQWRRPSAAPP